LLEVNGLDRALAEPLIDWIDIDSTAQPGGAEDLDYLNLDPSYRAANRALKSVDELRLIKGYTDEVVEKLRPYVVALPNTNAQATPINVNTAPAAVLAALVNVPLAQAEQLEKARAETPYNDRKTFSDQWPGATNSGAYDVATSYFIVAVDVQIGRTQRRSEGLIERPIGGAQPAIVLWSRQPPLKIALENDKKS
jgi:general secretion pathway protein K